MKPADPTTTVEAFLAGHGGKGKPVYPACGAGGRTTADDGLQRHHIRLCSALRFIGLAAREGVGAVIAERDGPFADYSQGPPEERPDPTHVIHPPRR